MRSKKGFTLIELMVVVLIVAVLAAILVPLLTARLESARWAEGRAAMGTIATSVRAYHAEHQESTTPYPNLIVPNYMTINDLLGKYFNSGCYSFSVPPAFDGTTLTYTIQCITAPSNDPTKFSVVTSRTLDQDGLFVPD